MAQRRMFTVKITDSDHFLDMPLSTQALYMHLCMHSDDDGFCANPKRIQRMIGCGDDDMRLLLAKRFLLAFESGVVVIKHWRMHNLIRKDRYEGTQYTFEKAMLIVKDDGAYTENDGHYIPASETQKQLETSWQPNGNQMATQVRLVQGSTGKASLVDSNAASADAPAKPTRHKYGQYQNVLLSDDDLEKLKNEFPNDWEMWIEKLSEGIAVRGYKYKNHLAAIRSWSRKEKGTANAVKTPAANPALNYAQRDVKDEDFNGIFMNLDEFE